MSKRLFQILPCLALAAGLLFFSLQPAVDRLAGPPATAPAPQDCDPSRQQEGGPDQRRAWEEQRLADPVTGRIPADIHRLEHGLELVDQGDVHGAVDVLEELGGLGDFRGIHGDHVVDGCAVHLDGEVGTDLVQAADKAREPQSLQDVRRSGSTQVGAPSHQRAGVASGSSESAPERHARTQAPHMRQRCS